MLRVDRLEISGFKSFVDPVTVDFAGGVTAIVGPNGCGKSNLSDAMTWVLGEQSAKNMRGGTMEDVIFNGSDARKPLGMAECTLTLRTDPSFPKSEDGKITIGRRVFRGGESQYRLNGKRVALKDIRDLLMDTGLGIRAYSVIEQGKIGMILSGKPQERRKLIEEAAGITRYKARKGVAEVKLEEATANLLRLDDVVGEVDRALRSLKRQASAARRYQEKETEYRELLEKVLLGRWSNLAERLADLKGKIEETTSREAGLAADLHRDEAALAAGRQRLDEMARALAERHQKVAEFAAQIEGRQEFLKANRQTVVDIGERASQGRALADRREQEIESHVETLEMLEDRRRELEEEREQAARAVQHDEQQIAAAERDLKQVAARGESLRNQMAEAANAVHSVRQKVQQAQIDLEKGNFRRNRVEEEMARHNHEMKQASETLAIAQEKVATVEETLKGRVADQERVASALEVIMRREAEASERKRDLEDSLTGSRQRQRILAELSRAHAQRRAALEKALTAAGLAQPQFLAGQAKAVEGWERSLDVYLGSLADAVVLEPGASALDLARALAGRSAAILIERRDAGDVKTLAEALPLVEDPAVVLSIGEALGVPEELALALPPAFLVRAEEDAERLARLHPGVAFLARNGIWAQAGTFHVPGETANPGVLERESELANLAKAIPDLERQLQEATAELARLVNERASLAKESNRLQGEVAQARQELAVGKARMEDAAARHRRLSSERETLTNQQQEIAREIERATERRQQLLDEMTATEERNAGLQEDFDRAQAELEAAKSARESLRTESAGRKGRLDLLDERLESQDREMSRLRAEIDRGKNQIAVWREDADKLATRRVELTAAIEKAEQDLQTALEKRAQAEEGTLEEQDRLDRHRDEIRALEERIQDARSRRDAVRGEVEELRIRQASLKQDAEHLAVSYQEQFERPLPETLPEGVAATTGNLAEMEAELARTKAALERLGPVNILAVQEHDEQEERLTFLTTQRADVEQSVESLRKTIKEINEASAQMFNATFVEVNKAFGELFAQLFRGGEAEMRLLDETDPLESGIEILARPPGKRLQNLMLMSGGEKALTAIALLFALFRTKPSPFCILDEVDAPLDDVNTTRFVDMLREMTGDTQFIVITHNKLTMAVASSLYGVTMQEKGVSKLVSVRIDDVQPEERRRSA
jgi:chromosome segregation protein